MSDTVKIRIAIEINVESALANQIHRTGFSVTKNGTYLRVRVGDQILARDQAKVTFNDEDSQNAGASKKQKAP